MTVFSFHTLTREKQHKNSEDYRLISLMSHALERNFQNCVCFIDYEKTLHKIQHNTQQLLAPLGQLDLDEKDITWLKNL